MDHNLELSLAVPADALVIANMSRDLVEAGLRWSWKPSRILSMIQAAETVVLIARSRFGVAGFAIMEFHDTHAHLNLLAVSPQQRRMGVGKALVDWLLKSAGVAGIDRVILEVRETNDGAIEFYRSLGFETGKHLKGYYQGREDAVTMVNHLIAPEIASQRPV